MNFQEIISTNFADQSRILWTIFKQNWKCVLCYVTMWRHSHFSTVQMSSMPLLLCFYYSVQNTAHTVAKKN